MVLLCCDPALARDASVALAPSPIVALNRAVAVARVEGPAAGLAALAAIDGRAALDTYYLLPAVEGQLWMELGERERAADGFRDALARPCSAPERRFIRRKLEAITGSRRCPDRSGPAPGSQT